MSRKTCSKILGLALLVLIASGAHAQAVTAYTDDFQSYGTQKNPPGWVDSSVGTPRPEANGLYKTWPDPTEDNRGTNVVYGTKQASGKPEGNNPRIGTFSTYTASTFSAAGRFEYRGRFIRTDSDSRIGFSFLSSYPETDKYYLIGLWSQTGSANLSMQLFAFGAGTPGGTLNSLFTPATNQWYRFAIQVDDTAGKTNIRARFWPEAQAEPSTWSIEASDSSPSRLTSGRIGIWSAVKGEVYVDDLGAKSPVDHEAPVIVINENNAELPEGKQFNRFVTPVIVVTDDTPNPTVTITLDGAPFVSGTQITQQGNHALKVVARDIAGHESVVTRNFFIDSLPPVVTLLENGQAFPAGEPLLGRAALLDTLVQDASTVTTTLVLDGQPYTANTPVNVEKEHVISGKSVDALGNETIIAPRKFYIDLFAPVITVTEQGQPLTTYYDRAGVTPDIAVTDATETTKTYTIKEGEATRAFTSGTALTTEAKYELSGSATDRIDRTTTFGPLTFYIDRSDPVITVTANGEALPNGKVFGGKVDLDASITDLTLKSTAITLDGEAVTLPLSVTAAGTHKLTIVATDQLSHVTTYTRDFVIDVAGPIIQILESNLPLPDGAKFNRFVTLKVVVTDDTPNPTFTITRNGLPYTNEREINEQGTHVIKVMAEDAVGNKTELTRTLLIDSLPPVVTLRENGQPFPAGEPLFDRAPVIDALTEDASTYTTTLLLDGQPYVPNTPVNVEKEHVISGTSVDALLNETTIAPRKFSVDLFAPVITVTEQGQALVTYYDRPSLTPVITVTDATATTDVFTIKKGDASEPFTSGTVLTAEAKYELAGSATDKVNRTTSFGPLTFYLDRSDPVVTVTANGEPLINNKIFGKAVDLAAVITDLTLKSSTITLDNVNVTLPLSVTAAGPHKLTIVATDELQHTTSITLEFVLDLNAPVIVINENDAPLPEGKQFNRAVTPVIVVTDDTPNPTVTITLDGQPFTSGTQVTGQGTHVLKVVAKDTVGNEAELTRNFFIDSLPPVVILRENGQPFPAGEPLLGRPAILDAVTEDASSFTTTLVLDGQPYTPNTPVNVEKEHVISGTSVDALLNETIIAPRKFYIDLFAPVITVTEQGQPLTTYYDRASLTPVITVTDATETTKTFTIKEGEATSAFTSGTALTAEAKYELSGSATDKLDRTTPFGPLTFYLDRSDPVVTVTGNGEALTNNKVFGKAVELAAVITDLTLKSTTITLDNQNVTLPLSVTAAGPHKLTIVATDELQHTTSITLEFVLDLNAPVIVINENDAPLPEGKQFNRAVTPVIVVTDDTPNPTVTITLDGQPFTSGTQVTGQGTHVLKVVAKDTVGNEAELTRNFFIDSLPPVVILRENGQPFPAGEPLLGRPAILDAVTEDASSFTTTLVLDGQPYTPNTPVNVEKEHVISGTSVDALLNETIIAPRKFYIDLFAPVITVTEQGQPLTTYYDRASLTPVITVTDATETTKTFTIKEGEATSAFTSGAALTAEAKYELSGSATDKLDRTTPFGPLTFYLDRSDPVVTVTGNGDALTDNKIFGKAVDLAAVITDLTLKSTTITLDNATITLPHSVTAAGAHKLTIVATDELQHTTTVTREFVIDLAAPVIEIIESGAPLPEGKQFNRFVTLTIRVTDDTPAPTFTVTRNGLPYTSGTEITEQGNHTIKVLAEDAVGNKAELTRTLFIDSIAPVVTLRENGQPFPAGEPLFDRPARIDAVTEDISAYTTTLLLDGQPYTPNTPVDVEKEHVISGKSVDALLNETTIAPRKFFVDLLPPVITVTEQGQPLVTYYDRANVTPDISIVDATETTSAFTIKQGEASTAFTSGTPLTTEGKYELAGSATDKLNRTTTFGPHTFYIDRSDPVITITGNGDALTDDKVFGAAVTLAAEVTDLTLKTTTVTLDGVPVTLPLNVIAAGPHTLTIVATDELQHTKTVTVDFVLDLLAPVIQILESSLPLPDAKQFNRFVTLTILVNDDTPGFSTTITRNGQPYTSGTEITEQGTHTIKVVAKDIVGNEAELTRTLFIDSLPPVVILRESGQPFPAGEPLFDRAALIDAVTEDASAYTTTLVLDGQAYTPNTPIATEKEHVIAGESVDALLNRTVIAPRKFFVDLFPPVITVTEQGQALTTYYDRDVTPVITVADATETINAFTVKEGDASRGFTSGSTLTNEAKYELAGSATDKLNRTTTFGPLTFYIDRTAPIINVTGNGTVITNGQIFKTSVDLAATIVDLTLDKTTILLDEKSVVLPLLEAAEGRHKLTITATDKLGHTNTVTIEFIIDLTPPVVKLLNDTVAFPANGSYLRVDPIPTVSCTDNLTECTPKLLIDGTERPNRTPITEEGPHTLVASATDQATNSTTLDPVTFILDKTAPIITVTSHTDGAFVSTATVVIEGGSDDAVTVSVNGKAATVDATSKRYRSEPVTILDGDNVFSVVGIDAAGNTGTTSLRLVADLRNPDLQVLVPAANACVREQSITVSGTTRDVNIESVKVTVDGKTVTATLDASKLNWTASIAGVAEGQQTVSVEAVDTYGHKNAAAITIIVDRTLPVIDILESGVPFNRRYSNRPVSFFIRARDLDPNVKVVATIGNAAYVNGTSIATDGDYRLTVTATDCAGNTTSAAADFTIDQQPPVFTNLVPGHGATVAAKPAAVSGNVSADAVSVDIEGNPAVVTPNNGSFFISGTFSEGVNTLALHAVDRAGNETRLPYTFTVRSDAPVVTIREGGTPLQDGTVFNRAVTLEVSADDATATTSATLNGQPYTGAEVTEDGAYTIVGQATNQLNLTGTQTRAFRIDRTGPVVTITSPTGGDVLTNTITVTGTVTDATSVFVNGTPATLTGNNFSAAGVPLEPGENFLVAVGYDAAGNSGRDDVTVNLVRVAPGILITEPLHGKLTNRPRVDVAGRVLSPPKDGKITVGTHSVTVDSTGAFRFNGYELVEGDNVITATAINADSQSATSSVTVIGDFTPPVLTILADGTALADEQQFPQAVGLSLSATDNRGEVTTRLWIDGFDRTAPLSITATGGHAATALARDKAGNETRVERTFFIGTSAGSSTCSISSVDPSANSVITDDRVRINGRSPGAVSVKVAGATADLTNGSFSAEIPLPVEGENSLLIQCTDATGKVVDLPYKLVRATGQPSIDITSPAEGHITGELSITVSGTVGDDVLTADVNGKPATIGGTPGNRTFTVSDVSLADGINVLAAHARNAANRLGSDSVRVRSIQRPPAISITAPVTNYQTGLAQIAVSGTYNDLDPATLAISGGSGSPSLATVKLSDTTGSYIFSNVGIAAGDNTLTVTGRNLKGVLATASVTLARVPDLPSVVITSPADNAWLRKVGDTPIPVSGFYADAVDATGGRVDVNANAATVDAPAKTYAGTAHFVEGGITPLVARYTNDAGAVAIAVSRVNRLGDPLTVKEAFPALDAQEVDPGAIVLISFSAPVAATAVDANVSLNSASGKVSGKFFIDDKIVTFVPDNLLLHGVEYTIAVTAAMTDIAGNPIDKAFSSKFTTASTAPNTPPAVDPVVVASCSAPVKVTGTAPPAARLLLTAGDLEIAGTAGSDGKFSILLPLSGQSGYQTVRVRVVGADGTFSPAGEASFLLDCAGPYVLLADYNRTTNKLTVTFSKPVKASTIIVAGDGSLILTSDDAPVAGTAEVASAVVTVTPATDLRAKTFSLTVMPAVTDLGGNALSPRFDKTFIAPGDEPPPPQEGEGYITGEVYDATTGRPLAGARLRIAVPAAAFARTAQTLSGRFTLTGTATAGASRRPSEIAANEVPVTITTDARGRYTRALPEGAHTIEVTAVGYTSVWRQIVVPAGAGVVPIDIRLTRRPTSTAPSGGSATTLTDGGGDDNKLTHPATLSIPAGTLPAGSKVSLTAVGAQSIAGLLPVGWSPLASAEISVFDSTGAAVSGASIGNSTLAFTLPGDAISTANQTLALARYDSDRDEWIAVVSVFVKGGDGKWSSPVSLGGAYAVVYPDQAVGLKKPAGAEVGAALQPSKETCLTAVAPCALSQKYFDVDPKYIPPTGRAVARLEVQGSAAAEFPSGTAVQAYVTETLKLSNGAVMVDPPFAADVLLYRTLKGDFGVAEWYLEPSKKAADVVLSEGVDHVEVVEYPGRLDRGTLIGPEGGRVPGDDEVTIDIPTGSTNQPLHAGVVSLQQADLAGTIDGFKVMAGFELALGLSEPPPAGDANDDGVPDPEAPVTLNRAARATVTINTADLPAPAAQLILVESLDGSLAGRVRLAAILEPLDAATGNARRYTTRAINVATLPVDGVIREGRYYVLAALAPVAWATGSVRLGATGPYAVDADVTSFALPANTRLGVTDVSRGNGVFALPVPAETQGGFAVIPSLDEIGTGQARVVATAPQRDTTVALGDLILEAQRPVLESWSLNTEQQRYQVDSLKAVVVTARFTEPIDPNSKSAVSLVNTTKGQTVLSVVTVSDRNVSLSPVGELEPSTQYAVVIDATLRGANGAPFGTVASYDFSTRDIPVRGDFDPSKIRITIPVNGMATITGTDGAVPGTFRLLAVRRDRDFVTKPNARADNNGAFTMSIGATTGDDRLDIGDLIDLYVINTADIVWARVPLGPFVSPDFKSFVAPANKTVTFRSIDNVIATIEAGTFDVATIVTLAKEQPQVFLNSVQNAGNDVNVEAAVRVSFEGEAKKEIILSLDVPAGVQTAGRYFITGQLMQSIRGPRIEAVTAAGITAGKFQSGIESGGSGQQASKFAVSAQGGEKVVDWPDVKKFLRGVRTPGLYGFMDIRVPQSSSFGWAIVDSIQSFQEVFFEYLASFVSTALVSQDLGTRVIPVLTNMPLTVVGVDTSSGLQAFKKVYAPLAPGDPGVSVILEPPTDNVVGPFPIFGLPFRAEVYQVPSTETSDTSIRNFVMAHATSGQLTITGSGTPIDPKYRVEAFNTRTGQHVVRSGSNAMTLTGVQQGDRIIIFVEQIDVDPTAQIALTFNEAIAIDTTSVGAAEVDLRSKITISVANEPDSENTSDAVFENITPNSTFRINSGNRRVEIDPGQLRRGAIYRITLKTNLTDQGTPPLAIGSVVLPGGMVSAAHAQSLYFRVRKPHGLLTSFNLKQIDAGKPGGALRELSQRGNVLFVAAVEGGLQAYDLSNPAKLGDANAKPFAMVEPGVTDFWGVTTDHHNRVYTVGLTTAHGVIRSYRMEQFVPIPAPGQPARRITGEDQKGNAVVSLRPGWGSGLPQSSATLLSDRPEAIPRKLTILVQDTNYDFSSRLSFETFLGTSGSPVSGAPDFKQYTYTHAKTGPYERQRVTIENISQGLRWSDDAEDGAPAQLTGIIATAGDRLKLMVNERTYAVVPLIGYGFSVFDMLAMESNDVNPDARMTERIVTTKGEVSNTCDQSAMLDQPCHIPNLASTPDVLLRDNANGNGIKAFALDPRRGVLDVIVNPPPIGGANAFGSATRAPAGLPFIGDKVNLVPVYHPRLEKIAEKYNAYAGHWPVGRFSSLSAHTWKVSAKDNPTGARGSIPNQEAKRDYIVIAGHELGVLVVEVGGSPTPPSVTASYLTAQNLVDVIWTPAAALAVRVIPDTNYAVVLDQLGRVLLIDLSRVDERWDGPTLTDLEVPFKTALTSLATDNPDAALTGVADPRIIWISPKGYGFGTLPPVIDPDTGMIYTGEILGQKVSVIAALDPKILVKADVGAPFGVLQDVGGIVPLGVKPPVPPAGPNLVGDNASLAAFRIEVGLPGSIAESLAAGTDAIPFSIESERMADGTTEQTPPGYPRAHLRRVNSGGVNDPNPAPQFKLRRYLPDSMAADLRHQKGFNKFVSPWVVGIADFRASTKYSWPGGPSTTLDDKEKEGCYACDRPLRLKDKPEPEVFEIYTNGRMLNLHTETNASGTIFTGTPYDYLGKKGRLGTRIQTVMADTLRTKEVLTAAQNPPVAAGTMMGTVFMHSGELLAAERDLSAGGRGGMDVAIDRVYRSRTIGNTPFGQNWDSPLFRRLRALPNGNVEYRDETGELWLFKLTGTKYESPKGLFLRLGKSGNGWQLTDQKWRRTTFDQYGRILSEEDEFADISGTNGNFIRYIYDAEGRLKQVIDPVYRATTLQYWEDSDQGTSGAYPGFIKEIKDWRDRTLKFEYDANGRLLETALPPRDGGSAPVRTYEYEPVPGAFNEKLERQANLERIIDPAVTTFPAGSAYRVEYTYNSDDKVENEKWGTGETVELTYGSNPTSTDIYGQLRTHTVTNAMTEIDYTIDRQHVTKIVEAGVKVSNAGFANLPIPTRGAPSTTDVTRTTELGYNTDGTLDFSKILDVRETKFGWESVEPEAPGSVLKTITSTALGVPALTAPPAPIVQTFHYQGGGSNTRSFLSAVEVDGKKVDSVEPHRGSNTTTESNNLITSSAEYDPKSGYLKTMSSTGGNDSLSAGSSIINDYWTPSDPKHTRGLLRKVARGTLATQYEYPSATQMKITDERSIETTINLDDWNAPKTVTRTGDVPLNETFEYNDRGQVTKSTRKQGSDDVTTTYKYDGLGQVTEVETDNINTPSGKMKSTTEYVVAGGKRTSLITIAPGDAKTTSELDKLGRVVKSQTDIGPYAPLLEFFAYDLDGNVVHSSDDFTCTTASYDAFGRRTTLKYFDLTRVETTYDGWNRPLTITRYGADGATVAKQTFDYEAAGALKEAKSATGVGDRVARMSWDGGGRSTGVAVEGRASHTKFDSQGRVTEVKSGPGVTPTGISNPFTHTTVAGWDGMLPTAMSAGEPRAGATYTASSAYNSLGITKLHTFGSMAYEQDTDQEGNVTRYKPPGVRTSTTWTHDARGAVKTEKLPEMPAGNPNTYRHLASGALADFTDSKGEKTEVVVADRLGRPIHRKYEDNTFELFAYEGVRVKEYTDRQNRKRIFEYSAANGKLDRVRLQGGTTLESYGYDTAGRLDVLNSHDEFGVIVASVKFDQFDLDGNPHRTTQTRYRGGLQLDQYEQTHTGWNTHGERTEFTMPSYTGHPAGPWTRTIKVGYDDAGNINLIQRSLMSGGSLMTLLSSEFRSAGRPIQRTLTTSPIGTGTAASVVRLYGYDDVNAMPKSMAVSSNGLLIGGIEIQTFDGELVQTAKLLGVSGGDRVNQWTYDTRGRVKTARIAGEVTTTLSTEAIEPWDFRSASQRTVTTPFDPPSVSFTEQPGHKIATMTRGTEPPRTFTYNNAERLSDGKFIYEFDWKGRLLRAEELPSIGALSVRRVRYEYNALDRMVGRIAEFQNLPTPGAASSPTAWIVENRQPIIAADSLPAETTFVWDPLSDQLVAIYKAGASANPAIDAHGGLVKQIINGGLGYDDPIEVTTLDLDAPTGVDRLYPVYDETATGNLQVLLNVTGTIVARTFAAGAYGEEEYQFVGAAVDNISFKVKKSGSAVESIELSIRVTEELDPATAAAGGRLVAIDGTSVVRAATVAPVVDGNRLKWTLTPAQFTALTAAPATALSVAVTDDLRALAWGEGVAVLPPPQWATESRPIFTSSDLPVELREPITNLNNLITAAGTETTTSLYEVSALAAIGEPRLFGSGLEGQPDPARQLGASTFHAHPFQEPVTGHNYVRARWYDLGSGTWLTPDPKGYVDSSNLYAFAGGDPVNRRDPTGERAPTAAEQAKIAALKAEGKALHDAWTQTGYAELTTYGWGSKGPGIYRSINDMYGWVEVQYAIETEYQFQNARRMLVENVAEYEQAIREADAGEAVEYTHIAKRRLEQNQRLMAGVRLVGAIGNAVGARGGRSSSPSVHARVKKGDARYRYEANTGRYRDMQTGRFKAERDLPYPDHHGFASSKPAVLKPGTIVDRYGQPTGKYASQPGATISERGLPPGTEHKPYKKYKVMKPVEVEVGPAVKVDDFAASGGATQYYFKKPMSELVREGVLKEIP